MRRDFAIITAVFLALSLAFYLFVARTTKTGLDNIYKSWDGPSYVVTAISLYDPAVAYHNNIIQSPDIKPTFTFLPAHFPLYPLLIRLFSPLGYFRAAVGLSLLFSLLGYFVFYALAQALGVRHPLWLTLPMLLFPPRRFIIAHVGSSEPIFIFFVLLAILFFVRRRLPLSAAMAALAQLTRPQGALLGLGFLLVAACELYKTRDLSRTLRDFYPYLLIPLSLLLVFVFYYFRTGDFWAFFKAIAIFHHFRPELFPAFKFPAENIETFWQEISVVDYTLYLAATLTLLKSQKLRPLGLISGVFYLPLLFLQHADISRYALPLVPFAYLAFAPFLQNPLFTLAALATSPAVFRYASTFVSHNRAI